MSRFNNPQTPQPQRGVPQPVAPQRQEPRPVPPPTNPYGSLSSYGQQGYAADGQVLPQPQAPGPFAALRPDPRYAQPAADPYAANGYAAPADSFNALAGQAAAGYAAPAPAYDPYAAAAPQAGGYAAQAGYAPVQSQSAAAPSYQDPYAARQDLRSASFDQWSPGSLPQADPYQGGTHQAANGYEPQAFDAQGFPAGRAPAAAAPAHAPAHWGAQTDPYARPGYGAQPNGFDAGGFDAGGLDAAGAFGGGTYPQQPAATSFEQGYAEDEAEYEDDVAAPRSYKRLAVLLASTVILGGGLALAYVNLTAAPQTTASAPVVKGDDSPFKVKPSDPGGKQFAHTDSKVMGRLGEGTAASGSSTGDVDPVTGARKVSTVVVGRDGSIQAGAAESSAQPAAPAPSSASIPGMVVVGVPPAASASEPAAPQSQTVAASGPPAGTAAPAEQASAAAAPSAPKKPQMIATASVPPSASASAAASADAAPAAPAAAPPKKEKKVAALAPAAPASAAATPTPARPTGAGYVAVLASVPASASSRIDALKQFADLQQKYGTILSDKTPDVMEASVSGKGTYHRLVVGPPGSREGANQVCSQLKAQGYASCWVMAY